MVVGRGVVLAASYEARAFGIRGAMGGAQARSLCPWVIAVDPRMEAYTDASKAVFDVFARTTPIVEGISIDEAFLDVGGLRRVSGEPVEIARRLRHQVRDEVGLPITIGVASSKFLAKVASAVAKPDGLLHVPAGEELAFLHPLPVERLWGVGPITSASCTTAASARSGRSRACPRRPSSPSSARGGTSHPRARPQPRSAGWRPGAGGGRWVRSGRWAAGADRSPSWPASSTPSAIGSRLVCARASAWPARSCCGSASTTSRAALAHAASADVAHPDGPGDGPVAAGDRDAPHPRAGLTLIGIALSNLDDADAIQLSLPFDRHALAGLDAALDGLRERFGSKAVVRAAGRAGAGPAMPVLPD